MTNPTETVISYPVSKDQAKQHLRLDIEDGTEDAYVRSLIYVATEAAEDYVGKSIAYTRKVLNIWDFTGSTITLDEGNFLETETVITDASILITVDEEKAYFNSTIIELDESVSSDPLEVTYLAGYTTGNCPYKIQQAILVKVCDLYDMERSSYNFTSIKENRAFERLLDPYKLVLFV